MNQKNSIKKKMNEKERFVDALSEKLNNKGKPLYLRNKIRTNKYTILTFLPLNLFHQFSRLANFYFLIVVLLLQFNWAPISASAAVVPLILVIGISAIREAYEDYLRWKSDQKINAQSARRIENSEWVETRWDQLRVGDVIEVRKDEEVPADVVLFTSSDENGISYIETSNLDGESNLKVKRALECTQVLKEPNEYREANIKVCCDLPNNQLYTFKGRIIVNGKEHSLDNNNVILRGCKLKNVNSIMGLVVYAGHDTKIMKNAASPRNKRSLLERGLNKKLISVFIIIFALAISCALVGWYYEKDYVNTNKIWYYYRNEGNKRNTSYSLFILIVSHLIVINAMVPISLYVTLEVVRVFQGLFILWDKEMYDPDIQSGCVPRTTNITDDLGQIEYIFSDKTGTLTQNVMQFMECSIGGTVYSNENQDDTKFYNQNLLNLIQSNQCPEIIHHFALCLATNHSVIPEKDQSSPYGVDFKAQSPDESALVTAAADLGFVFSDRTIDSITINILSKNITKKLTVVANLEFTSERKRSSVILKDPDTNTCILYSKGADDTIFSRLERSNTEIENETKENLHTFSRNGFRTLCLAYRVLDSEYVDDWYKRYREATLLIHGREEAVESISNEIEQKLTLIGATAIEDKLQENVADTIDSMLKAGMHVWVITGDKKETAINIGYSCALLKSDMNIISINEDSFEQDFHNAEEASNNGDVALILSGNAVAHLIEGPLVDKFVELTKKCSSIICCRVSPLQKAEIVSIMRNKTNKMAVAIGDGANDVGMILQADVGIGISGKEGRQAVLASDFAISKFKFLKRLLLVHGRLNFYRNVECINYSFYKNTTFAINQIIFACFSHFSGNTIYNSILYTVYNVFFTSIPIIVFSGADRDVSLDSMMKTPELYQMDGNKKWLQSYIRFIMNIFLGAAHAVLSFFITFLICTPFVSTTGFQITKEEFGAILYMVVVTIVNVRVAQFCNYWTWMHFVSLIGSVLIFPTLLIIVDYMHLSVSIQHVSLRVVSMPQFWLSMLTSAFVVAIPIVLEIAIERGKATLTNKVIIRERIMKKLQKQQKHQKDQNDQKPIFQHLL